MNEFKVLIENNGKYSFQVSNFKRNLPYTVNFHRKILKQDGKLASDPLTFPVNFIEVR